MKNNVLHIFTVFLLVLTFGCGQYAEGPDFTFHSKQKRLTGKWKLTAGDQFVPGETLIFEFCKGEAFLWEHTIDGEIQSGEGTWQWAENKFVVFVNLKSSVIKYEILKLQNDELKIKDTDLGAGLANKDIWEFKKE